jgi:hypothetical protein
VVSGRDGLRDPLGDERSAHGDAGAERLADRDEIWRQTKRRGIERLARASQASLDLVGNEQRPGVAARLVDGVREGWRHRPDPALALDRLRDDGGRPRAHGPKQCLGVLRIDERDRPEQRRERGPVVFVVRDRQRAQGPAREPALDGDELLAVR